MPETNPAIARMTSKELGEYIEELDRKHKAQMKALRALQRVRQAEEEERE